MLHFGKLAFASQLYRSSHMEKLRNRGTLDRMSKFHYLYYPGCRIETKHHVETEKYGHCLGLFI
jgi:hypothetical protein